MIFITSLSPSDDSIEKQQSAIDSWCKLGYKSYSVNTIYEIITLKSIYRNIDFIETKSSAIKELGKPYIYVNDVMKLAGTLTNDIICMINSDIIIHGDTNEIHRIIETAQTGLVFCSRFNYTNDFSDALKEDWGFDIFFFHKKFIPIFRERNYTIGTPWWDYWMPYTFIFNSITAINYDKPLFYHKLHPLNWTIGLYYKQLDVFSEEYHENDPHIVYQKIMQYSQKHL